MCNFVKIVMVTSTGENFKHYFSTSMKRTTEWRHRLVYSFMYRKYWTRMSLNISE